MADLNLKCAQCGSDTVQRLSFLYQDGMSRIDTRTRSTGIGFGRGGIGLGIGRAKTKGVSQTGTSARAAPPKKRRYFAPMLLILIGVAILPVPVAGDLAGSIHGLLLLGAETAWVYFAYSFNSRQWPALMQTWTHSYLCSRCDHISVIG